MATLTRTEEIEQLAADQTGELRAETRDKRGRLKASRWRSEHLLPLADDYSKEFHEPPAERTDQEAGRRPGRRWLKPDPKLKRELVGLLAATDYRETVARRTWMQGPLAVSVHEVEAGYAYGRGTMAPYEIRTAGSPLLKLQPLPPAESWPWALRRPTKIEIPSGRWTPRWPKPDIKVYPRSAITRTITDQQAFKRMCNETLLYTHRVDALDNVIRRLVEIHLEELAVRAAKGDPRMLRVRPRRGPKRQGLFAPVKMGGADPADERELSRRLVIEEQFDEVCQRLNTQTPAIEAMIGRRDWLRREGERDRKAVWRALEERDAKRRGYLAIRSI
jgi:hypothetical protein